jgi:hypothetical protein
MRHASVSLSRYLGSGSGLAFLTSGLSRRQVSRYGDGFDYLAELKERTSFQAVDFRCPGCL